MTERLNPQRPKATETATATLSENDIAKIRQDFDTAMEKMQNSSNVRLQAVESQNKKETRGDKMNTPSVLTSKTTSSKDKSSEFMQNSPTPTSEATSEFQDKDTNNSSTNQNLRLQKSQTSLTPENAQEMQRIKDQAQANGSFMKAPNGKPTRLNERQWLQVRTDKFKKWFGDWELASKKVDVISTVQKFKNFADAKKWAIEHIAKVYNNEETGGKGEIEISNSAITKYFNESAVSKSDNAEVHKSVISVLPEVIKNSVVGETHSDYIKKDGERKPKNGIAPNTEIKRLYGAVEYEGKIYRVKTTVKYFDDNSESNRAHTYEVTKIELLDKSNNSEREQDSRTVSPIPTAKLLKGVEKSYEKGKFILDNSSKVLDENGEPLEVAHSTDKEFTAFKNKQENDSGWLGAGYYFFGDRSLDGQYGENVMNVFLDIRNPYYASDEEVKKLSESNDKYESQEFTNELISEGYDGVYYNGNLNQEWVAFSPNQIKSTDNNNGNFDQNKADIRFQATKNLQNSSENDNFAKQNKNNEIPDKSPQEKLGSGNEVHSREQEASVYISGRIRAAEEKLQRQLQGYELEDAEKQAAFDYAKENGLWIDNLYSLGEPTGLGGNENTLAIDKENNRKTACLEKHTPISIMTQP